MSLLCRTNNHKIYIKTWDIIQDVHSAFLFKREWFENVVSFSFLWPFSKPRLRLWIRLQGRPLVFSKPRLRLWIRLQCRPLVWSLERVYAKHTQYCQNNRGAKVAWADSKAEAVVSWWAYERATLPDRKLKLTSTLLFAYVIKMLFPWNYSAHCVKKYSINNYCYILKRKTSIFNRGIGYLTL